MTKITTVEEGLLRVEIDHSDGSVNIGKCDTYYNFEHGADWELPTTSLAETKQLIALLTEAVNEFEQGAVEEPEEE